MKKIDHVGIMVSLNREDFTKEFPDDEIMAVNLNEILEEIRFFVIDFREMDDFIEKFYKLLDEIRERHKS